MYTVKQLPAFSEWMFGLKDGLTRCRLARRLQKAQNGNLGDVGPVGEGVSEMREHFGPGWRMYYVQRGDVLFDCDAGRWRQIQPSRRYSQSHKIVSNP